MNQQENQSEQSPYSVEINLKESEICYLLYEASESNSNSGWLSLKELVIVSKQEKNFVAAHLRAMIQKNMLENIPGNGSMATRYRIRPELVGKEIPEFKSTVEVMLCSEPCCSIQNKQRVSDIHSTKKSSRNISGQFVASKNGQENNIVGALSTMQVIDSTVTKDDSGTIMVLEVNKRPGGSRIAIAIDDAILIGQKAIRAMMEKPTKSRKSKK